VISEDEDDHGRTIINLELVGRRLRLVIEADIVRRYAADKDATVTGAGGGGSSRRDGNVSGIARDTLAKPEIYISWVINSSLSAK